MKSHGHVTPNPDGSRARCGGPSICSVCARELAAKMQEEDELTRLRARVAELERANKDLAWIAASVSQDAQGRVVQ